jgi:cell division protein FtsB
MNKYKEREDALKNEIHNLEKDLKYVNKSKQLLEL